MTSVYFIFIFSQISYFIILDKSPYVYLKMTFFFFSFSIYSVFFVDNFLVGHERNLFIRNKKMKKLKIKKKRKSSLESNNLINVQRFKRVFLSNNDHIISDCNYISFFFFWFFLINKKKNCNQPY